MICYWLIVFCHPEASHPDVVAPQAEGKVPVALSGLQFVGEQLSAVHRVGGGVVPDVYAHFVPMAGAQQMVGVGVFLQEGFHPRVVFPVAVAVVAAEAGGGVFVASEAHVEEAQRVVAVEPPLPPRAAGEEVVGVLGVSGCPEAVEVAQAARVAACQHLGAEAHRVRPSQAAVKPQRKPVGRGNVERVAVFLCNGGTSRTVFGNPRVRSLCRCRGAERQGQADK